ncbi:MAG: hypothetical protein PUB07_03390 [Clostridia bacterium]|nr:hypothetical protein [Clostridia bacterium]
MDLNISGGKLTFSTTDLYSAPMHYVVATTDGKITKIIVPSNTAIKIDENLKSTRGSEVEKRKYFFANSNSSAYDGTVDFHSQKQEGPQQKGVKHQFAAAPLFMV